MQLFNIWGVAEHKTAQGCPWAAFVLVGLLLFHYLIVDFQQIVLTAGFFY
jgi:hypothetical protein